MYLILLYWRYHDDDLAAVQASAGVDNALAAGAIVTAKRGYNSSSSSVTTSL